MKISKVNQFTQRRSFFRGIGRRRLMQTSLTSQNSVERYCITHLRIAKFLFHCPRVSVCWGVNMQGVLSAIETTRLIVAANGATIMLVLLASRWCFSIIGTIKTGSSEGRSVAFNILALAAYVAGASHFISEAGSEWLHNLTGIFFALNIALIMIDTTLIVDYGDTPTPKVFLSVAALGLGVVFFLGLVDLTIVAAAIEQEELQARLIRQ